MELLNDLAGVGLAGCCILFLTITLNHRQGASWYGISYEATRACEAGCFKRLLLGLSGKLWQVALTLSRLLIPICAVSLVRHTEVLSRRHVANTNAAFGNLNTKDREQLVQDVQAASKGKGFFQIINHGISSELQRGILYAAKNLFALPKADKLKVQKAAGSPFGVRGTWRAKIRSCRIGYQGRLPLV